jgi:hypothetical protein
MYSGNMANVYMTATVFCDQLEQDLSIVKDKFDEGDYPAVKAFAHRMKPNLKLFGVLDLHELVIEIENPTCSKIEQNAIPILSPVVTRQNTTNVQLKKVNTDRFIPIAMIIKTEYIMALRNAIGNSIIQ